MKNNTERIGEWLLELAKEHERDGMDGRIRLLRALAPVVRDHRTELVELFREWLKMEPDAWTPEYYRRRQREDRGSRRSGFSIALAGAAAYRLMELEPDVVALERQAASTQTDAGQMFAAQAAGVLREMRGEEEGIKLWPA